MMKRSSLSAEKEAFMVVEKTNGSRGFSAKTAQGDHARARAHAKVRRGANEARESSFPLPTGSLHEFCGLIKGGHDSLDVSVSGRIRIRAS
jgi:hypothetical protein